MRVAFFYLCAFVALMGAMAAMANGDYVSTGLLLVAFVVMPFLAKLTA